MTDARKQNLSTPSEAYISEILRGSFREISYGYHVPVGVISAWISCGPIFQLEHNLDTDASLDKLVYWWFLHGRHTFSGLSEVIDPPFVESLYFSRINDWRVPRQFLPPLLKLVYRHRVDLRLQYDIEEPEGAIAIWHWWIHQGSREYFGNIPNFECRQISALLEGILTESAKENSFADKIRYLSVAGLKTLLSSGVDKAITLFDVLHLEALRTGNNFLSPLQYLIHRNRSDLQAAFDLDTVDGRADFWDWWQSYGLTEYIGQHDWLKRKEALALLATLGSTADGLDRIRYRNLLQLQQAAFHDSSPVGDIAIAEVFDAIHFSRMDQSSEQPTPLMALIHRNRADLLAAFDLDTAGGRAGLWNWWQSHGLIEYPIVPPENVLLSAEMSWADAGPLDLIMPSSLAGEERQSSEVLNKSSAKNISLVGYPRGEFGLGEDIRLLRNSLQTAGIEPNVIKAPWQIIARQTINEQAEEADVADFDSDVMVYVMPAFDTLTLLNKVGPRAFSARRKIGYWQWELDRFPEPAKIAFDLIDEIWCHSEHSAKAFRSATDKPVTKVPLPVLVPEIREVPRSTFGMDDDNFIIFTSFDGASSISRKNPMGVILAFQQAFPRKEFPHARLIVKAMNTIDDALWRDCLRKAAIDHRIEILNKVLDRSEYYELLRCCDAVLSLHRAEGFGRLMAEAMAIGIPVIATAYSGNLDFMIEENSWLVSGELSPLIPGDYPFHQGQEWMEPDVAKAAEALRDCYDNPDKRARLVANAKVTIERYSPANCGKLYAELLARGS